MITNFQKRLNKYLHLVPKLLKKFDWGFFNKEMNFTDPNLPKSVITADNEFVEIFYPRGDEKFLFTIYHPAYFTLYFRGEPIYHFNSLADFRAFWDVMCGLEFHKYSKNPNFDITLRTESEIKELERFLSIPDIAKNIKTIEDEEDLFIRIVLMHSLHTLIWPTSLRTVVDVVLTPFDLNILSQIYRKFKDFNESDSYTEIRNKFFIHYINTLQQNRNKTRLNIFISNFYKYIKERSYVRYLCDDLYGKQPEYTNIELMYFFLYREDLIEFINALKLTRKAFLENKPFIINEENVFPKEQMFDKHRETYSKVVEFYFPSLIEKLSELVHYLEK